MPRREYLLQLKCPVSGCDDPWTAYSYDTQRDYREGMKRYGSTHRCVRHSQPEEVLDPADNPRTSVTYVSVAKTYYNNVEKEHRPLGLFWVKESKLTENNPSGNGFVWGPGFKAYAKDFPEGTRVTITAEVLVPSLEEIDD